ncbi:MAG: hypothetical protein IH840_06185 [Candidatus Heimdallarchaeota archaeon]|nr:hypothetical protein [Candidatus Heimdallarchaeota archaeon]
MTKDHPVEFALSLNGDQDLQLLADQPLGNYFKTYLADIPHPNMIRHTLKLWSPRQITARYRKITYRMVRQLKNQVSAIQLSKLKE